MIEMYLIEPEQPGARWQPFAGSAPLAELPAAGWTLAERWERALKSRLEAIVATHAKGARAAGATPLIEAESMVGPCWVADATFCPRLPPRVVGGAKRLMHGGSNVAWRLDPGERWRGPHDDGDGMVIEGLPLSGSWDLITVLEQFLFADTLIALEEGAASDPIPDGTIVLGNADAIALRGATLEPGVVLDVRKGAIILEAGVEVASGTRLEGPCRIGANTKLSGGSLGHLVAGPHCRLHGEISTSAFAGHANKSHDGFIGHSVIGHWVNLGAGTITSNLKNTYGQVRVDIGAERFDTGRSRLGSLIGDHVKTAIGTLLPTGAVIGTGANLFGAPRAPKHVPPFAWGDHGDAVVSLEAFLAVARRVMPRRDVAVDAAMKASLTDLHRRMAPSG